MSPVGGTRPINGDNVFHNNLIHRNSEDIMIFDQGSGRPDLEDENYKSSPSAVSIARKSDQSLERKHNGCE